MRANQTIRIREAKYQSKLPGKLRRLYLLGSYQGTLYIGSECGHEFFSDTIIFGYSLPDNAINESIRLKGGAWPESWTQKNNLLFVGTRFGNLTAIDMEKCQEVGHLEGLGNAINSIAVNEAVYFGVNGKGLYKSDIGLSITKKKKKGQVVSALALNKDKLFAFYFSNGNDLILNGIPAGGLVEVLDKDLEVLCERDRAPYAITQAINTSHGLNFSTRNTSNGWIPQGDGSLYELDFFDLSHRRLFQFPSAVNILREGLDGAILAGLKNGRLYRVYGEKEEVIASQTDEVTGIVVVDGEYYIGNPKGQILRVRE